MTEPDKPQESPLGPRVIDLKAEEVAEPPIEQPEIPAEEAGAVPPPPQPPVWRSARLWAGAAAAVLLVLLGAWLYRGFGEGLWPSDRLEALARRVDTLDAAAKSQDDRIAALGTSVDGLRTDTGKIAEDAGSLRTVAADAHRTATALKETTSQLSRRIDELDAAIKSAAAAIEALRTSTAPQTPPDGGPTVDPGLLAGLEQRVAALETALAELKAERGKVESDSAATALLSQALSDLKAKFGAGAPFQEEYDRVSRLVPAAPGLDILAPHAKAGIANAQGLGQELEAAIPSLPAPEQEPAPAEPGYWDWVLNRIGSVVTIRSLGAPDWRAIATRAADAAQAGDLAQAARLIDETEGDLPQLLNDWRAKARARLAAERALDEVSSAVLRQLAAMGGTP